jgi:soluble lytic murein transglycosylase-like protein
MDRTTFLVALGAIITVWYRTQKTESNVKIMVPWTPPKNADKYLPLIVSAENSYDLPPSLLARVLDIESAYREDIITGLTRSPAGALGIAQIVPRWHPTVNPLEPLEAIPYAAKYLHDLHARFGTWQKAIAAYNWGQGNLSKFLNGQIAQLPKETSNYLIKIFGSDKL